MPVPHPVASVWPFLFREAAQKMMNTNDAFQRALLTQLAVSERNRLVLRCDDLPPVNGSEAAYENVFLFLLQLILEESKGAPVVFLHINSMTEQMDSLESADRKRFSTQFNTSIAASADWQKKYKGKIEEIETLLQKNGAVLLVNQLKSTGLVFSISLPGKML